MTENAQNAVAYPTEPIWKVRWGKETIVQPSAFDVLATIGEGSYDPADHKHPKRGIAYRLFVQHRILIDDELTDEMFLMRLAEFGVIELSVSGNQPADILAEALDFSQSWHGMPIEGEKE